MSTADESATAAGSATAAATSAPSPFRVFVGNLSYDVDSDALRARFADALPGTEVVDAVAVKRYGRPAGYGFVTLADAAGVEAALALGSLEFGERAANIERAVVREPGAAPRGGRGRGRGGRGRKPRRTPRLPEGAEPSKTTLFVGNLPFNVIDQDLLNIFAEYAVVRAHVVRRFNGASRGFGFVTLQSEAQQADALATMAHALIDGRQLVVRAALSDEAHKPAAERAEHSVVLRAEAQA